MSETKLSADALIKLELGSLHIDNHILREQLEQSFAREQAAEAEIAQMHQRIAFLMAQPKQAPEMPPIIRDEEPDEGYLEEAARDFDARTFEEFPDIGDQTGR